MTVEDFEKNVLLALIGEAVPVAPRSREAGLVCQFVANLAKGCASSKCPDDVVGSAVHHGRATGPETSIFYPVCQRHRGWEMAKVSGVSIYE